MSPQGSGGLHSDMEGLYEDLGWLHGDLGQLHGDLKGSVVTGGAPRGSGGGSTRI